MEPTKLRSLLCRSSCLLLVEEIVVEEIRKTVCYEDEEVEEEEDVCEADSAEALHFVHVVYIQQNLGVRHSKLV